MKKTLLLFVSTLFLSLSLYAGGPTPNLNVKKGSTSISTGGSATLMDVQSGTTGTPEVFTLENIGSAALTVNSITITGTNATEFAVSTAPTSIAAGSSATVNVTFSPNSVATGKTVTLTISSSDPVHGSYTITLTANGVSYATTAVNEAQAAISSSKLYPNPVSDMANIELNLKTFSDVKVTLSDMMGKEVMAIASGNMASLNQAFSVANLNNGIYTVNYFINGAAAKSELLMVK